jgi:hypothetical protein
VSPSCSADPDDFRRMVRRAAELLTGEPVPADEPPSVTCAKAGRWVCQARTDEQSNSDVTRHLQTVAASACCDHVQ